MKIYHEDKKTFGKKKKRRLMIGMPKDPETRDEFKERTLVSFFIAGCVFYASYFFLHDIGFSLRVLGILFVVLFVVSQVDLKIWMKRKRQQEEYELSTGGESDGTANLGISSKDSVLSESDAKKQAVM